MTFIEEDILNVDNFEDLELYIDDFEDFGQEMTDHKPLQPIYVKGEFNVLIKTQ